MGTTNQTEEADATVTVSINGETASDTLSNLLLKNAVDLGAAGPDNTYGNGRVDGFASASAAGCAVGGIAELPEVAAAPVEAGGTSGRSVGLLVAAIAVSAAAVAVAIGGAGWHARRRASTGSA